MKTKGILTFVFCLCVSFVFGQTNTFPDDGRVGIGTTSPARFVHINAEAGGTLPSTSGSTVMIVQKNGNSNNANVSLIGSATGNAGFNFGNANDENAGFVQYNSGANTMKFRTNGSGVDMTITSAGHVGIGTENPESLLSVKGKIESEEVQVKATVADYVFKPDYNLLSLEEVESFINENGHLPNVQNEKEVAANRGLIKVGELAVSTLEKIEELTLHVIEMNKRLKAVEAENTELKKMLNNK